MAVGLRFSILRMTPIDDAVTPKDDNMMILVAIGMIGMMGMIGMIGTKLCR